MSFNFMAVVTICSMLEPKKIKSLTVSIVSPSICHEVMALDARILCLNVEFKVTSSRSSFTFIKRLFSSSLLSAIRVMSPAYLRLLVFLLAISSNSTLRTLWREMYWSSLIVKYWN